MKYPFKLFKKTSGFTLVELLVVIAIIGVLSTVLISAINPIAQLQRSRDAQRKTDIKRIQAALEQYKADCGVYPAPLGGPYPGGGANYEVPSPLTSTCAGATTYMQKVPREPIPPARVQGDYYFYSLTSGGQCYYLAFFLEDKNDTDYTSSHSDGFASGNYHYKAVTCP